MLCDRQIKKIVVQLFVVMTTAWISNFLLSSFSQWFFTSNKQCGVFWLNWLIWMNSIEKTTHRIDFVSVYSNESRIFRYRLVMGGSWMIRFIQQFIQKNRMSHAFSIHVFLLILPTQMFRFMFVKYPTNFNSILYK